MNIITLEQAGWKKVCPISELHIKDIERVLNGASYETVKTDEFLLCKPLISENSPPRKLILISNSLDKNNFKEWNKIISSQNYFYSNPYIKLHKPYIGDPENFSKRFLERDEFESFRALSELIFFSEPSQLSSVLQKYAIPSFFEKHPNGKVYFIRCDDMLATMNSAVRVLSDADIFGIDIFKKSKNIAREIPRSMRQAHQAGLEAFIETTLKSMLCFFPYIYGYVVSRIGGYIIILLEKPIKFKPEKSTLEHFEEGGIFDDIEKRNSLEQLLELARKKEADYNLIFKRFIHEQEFSTKETNKLIEWTVEHLNDFYIKILDLCKFHNTDNYIDFALHRKKYLSLERIFLEINKITFQKNSYLRKILYFDLHDKISSLMITRSRNRETIFKRLLRLSYFNGKIKNILQCLPEPFDSYFTRYGEMIYKSLIDCSYRFIWDKERKSNKGILLREIADNNKWLGKKYKNSRTKISVEDYCVNLLHEFRNTLHGYNLRNFKFEKYLAIHEGLISDYLPDLSLIWLFVMLYDINGVLNSEITKTDY